MKVCVVSRRYNRFEYGNRFINWIKTQFSWCLETPLEKLETVLIFGSDLNKKLYIENIKVYFVKDIIRKNMITHSLSFYNNSTKIIRKESPNVIHFQGMNDVISHYIIKRKINPNIKTIIQDHGTVYTSKYRIARFLFSKFDLFIFNSIGQESYWVKSTTLPKNKIRYIPEGTSIFKKGDKKTARKLTSIDGIPAILWIGNLDNNKDPITILKAIEIVTTKYPRVKLHFVFRNQLILNKVIDFISINNLEKNVNLIGEVSHNNIEEYINSSDYFILGSAKEGSGYSCIEAMSCGVIPILSNIPSFMDFTQNGNIGAIFKQGDHLDLSKKMISLFTKNYKEESIKIFNHYKEKYSAEAIVERTVLAYNS